MSLSLGTKREKSQLPEFTKKVGLFEGKVIAINPDAEEYNEILGIELKEDSKALEYLGKSQDGNTTLRVDFWLEETKNQEKFKVTFFLEDKKRSNKDETKNQYINDIGSVCWAADENNIPEWFAKGRDIRQAYVGEEDLYNFVRTWLSEVDYKDTSNVLMMEWKKVMKGNLTDLKSQVDGAYCTNVVAMATIKTVIKDDETKEYQGVYNRAFMYEGAVKNFNLVDFSNPKVLTNLRNKKSKDLKNYERFVLNVTGEYGCKDFYIFKPLKEYNPEDNLVASDKVISDDGADY
jgi:hypothetical protein